MSIAIKNESINESIGEAMGVLSAGSPWGRGFAVGLSLALVILLPLFFIYALIDGPIGDRIAARQHRQEAVTATRDFSSSDAPAFKNYLEK